MFGQMMDCPLTIGSIMAHARRLHGDVEIVSITADQPLHRYRYRDCLDRAARLANALARLGARRGDRVGTLAWNDHRHLEVYFAASGSGAVCHTVNPRLFPEQIEYIVNHAADRWLFLDPAFLPLVESLADRLPAVEAFVVLGPAAALAGSTLRDAVAYETLIADEPATFDWPELDERCASSLCYTSGTTGHPKGVLYSHRSVVLHTWGIIMPDAMALSCRDVVLPIVPMFHVNAWGFPWAAAVVGAKLVLLGAHSGDPAVLARMIEQERVTIAGAVPTVWLGLLAHLNETGGRITSLKRVVVGGSACPQSVMEELESKHGVYVHHAWGMTETSPIASLHTPPPDAAAMSAAENWTLRARAGRPLFGVDLKIVDDNGASLPWDGVAFGSLKVRGPWVCSGYFGIDDSPAHAEAGWFETGDVATIDARGNVAITDRTKDVIKSGGEWISSIELENIAVAHPQVAEAAVVGVTHPHWGERPLLCIVPRPGTEPDTAAILATFEGRVAKWWIPDAVLLLPSLPHTATGKLSKKDLREQLKDYRFPHA